MVSRIGLAGVVAVFAAGIWLVAAPFALGYQPAGAGWTGATKTDVIARRPAGGGRIRRAVRGHGRPGEQLYADARSAASLAGTADRENSGS